jgi:hypothetical protein
MMEWGSIYCEKRGQGCTADLLQVSDQEERQKRYIDDTDDGRGDGWLCPDHFRAAKCSRCEASGPRLYEVVGSCDCEILCQAHLNELHTIVEIDFKGRAQPQEGSKIPRPYFLLESLPLAPN